MYHFCKITIPFIEFFKDQRDSSIDPQIIYHRNLNGWLFLVAYGKMFWSSEDRVRARFHYAESRQNKP